MVQDRERKRNKTGHPDKVSKTPKPSLSAWFVLAAELLILSPQNPASMPRNHACFALLFPLPTPHVLVPT